MKSFNEQTYFFINKRVLLKVSGEELSWSVFFLVGVFRREFPDVELSIRGCCPGGTVREELSGGEFTGHPALRPAMSDLLHGTSFHLWCNF